MVGFKRVLFKRNSRITSRSFAVLAGLFFVLAFSSAHAVEFNAKDTKVTLGGYLKLMTIFDANGTVEAGPTEGDMVNAYDTPLDGTTLSDTDDFRMVARESRVFMKTSTKSDFGMLDTHIEADAYGDEGGNSTWSNSRLFRIRHAYGKLTSGPHVFLAGQTWSTFMDFAAAVPGMDLASDPGMTFVRQPQLRYRYNINRGHYIAASVENPDRGLTAKGPADLIQNAGNSTEGMPDFVVKYFYANKRFHISPKLLVRKFELDGKSTMGWGTSLTSHINFGNGHKVYAGFMWGDGIGRYAGLGLNGGAGITASGDIETVEFKSINGGVTFSLRDDLKLSIGAGYSENDKSAYSGPDAVLTADANKNAFSCHTTLKWNITPGLECAFGVAAFHQEMTDGDEGDMIRVQNYFKYSF